MNRHAIIIAYVLTALAISWSVWAWLRWPVQKSPSKDVQVQALLKQFEKEKQAAYDAGYTWAGAEPDPAVFMKGIDAYFKQRKP